MKGLENVLVEEADKMGDLFRFDTLPDLHYNMTLINFCCLLFIFP